MRLLQSQRQFFNNERKEKMLKHVQIFFAVMQRRTHPNDLAKLRLKTIKQVMANPTLRFNDYEQFHNLLENAIFATQYSYS